MGLTDFARDVAVSMVAEALKAAVRAATKDPAERRSVLNKAVERARSDLEAQAELDAARGR